MISGFILILVPVHFCFLFITGSPFFPWKRCISFCLRNFINAVSSAWNSFLPAFTWLTYDHSSDLDLNVTFSKRLSQTFPSFRSFLLYSLPVIFFKLLDDILRLYLLNKWKKLGKFLEPELKFDRLCIWTWLLRMKLRFLTSFVALIWIHASTCKLHNERNTKAN